MWKKRVGYASVFLILTLALCLICANQLKNSFMKDTAVRYSSGTFTIDEIDKNKERSKAFVLEDVTIPDALEVIKELGNVSREDVIAGILIPELDMNLPVFEGISRQNLLAGAGTLKEGQEPGEGNYGLAGHHMKDGSLLFGPLTGAEAGQRIYLTDLRQVVVYEITEIAVIHQNDIDVLDDIDEAVITLITCNISGVNTDQRLMVRGVLIEELDIEDQKDDKIVQDYIEYLEISSQNRGVSSLIWLAGIMIISGIMTFAIRMFLDR